MSVYKASGSRFFQYDFVHKGVRFTGPTGQDTRRSAERVERQRREEAALGKLGAVSLYTLDEAAGRWWLEVGRYRKRPEDVKRRVAQVVDLIGAKTPIGGITTSTVAVAMEKRRGQTFTKAPGPKATAYSLSNGTVNKDIIQTLRPILNRAQRVWEAKGLPAINWKDLTLKEPPARARSYTAAQQTAWQAECDPAARYALRTLLTYGLRFGELFFPPNQFESDEHGARITLMKGRKGDVPHVVPLREDDGRLLAALAGRARAAGLACIWFEVAADGELQALTYHGLHARLVSAAGRAGIDGGAVVHGTRHHAGTAIARRTGGLKAAKELLGHSSMASTQRYAHAVEQDLRDALELESRGYPEAVDVEVGKVRRRKRLV